jgi:predicted small lipoprotein YifL
MKKILVIIVMALFLNACGQTGKLVLPAKVIDTR